MDFTALRTQVIALLQREQRLSYRALKRQFALDDEDLEALKDELIYAKRLAVDEDGRVLVWTGGTSSALPTASPVPLPATPAVAPAQREAAPVGPAPPDAERRQLTVMFCDLVDSTKLSSQLDPEEYRDVVRAYQRVCTDVSQRYDGHIAQLLGDGLLVYFGWPQAHEDDAQRAVRTGLGILARMDDLNQELTRDNGIHLAVRVGIHTGVVVVGDMGSTGRQEQLALGETPNVAARMQGLAAPNTVVISDATYRLVQGYFACQDLGAKTLRGVAAPIAMYRVLGESGVTSRLEIVPPRGLTPLVGRESEVTLLRERWKQVKAGQGQVVLLSGDAGIGKSRLVQMLKEHVADEPHTRWECRSAEYYQNTALFPLTDVFQRLLRFHAEDTPDEKLAKLEQMLTPYRLPLEEAVPLFAPLLTLPLPEHPYPPLNLSPQRQRQKTLETVIAILLEQAEQQPVLFIVEDLHWTDPTMLELLNLLIDQTPTAAMCVLLTCRPTFQPSWSHRSYLSAVTVHRLSRNHIEQMTTQVAGEKTLPPEVMQQIVERTDGVPLFVEEITKSLLESAQLTAVDNHYALVGSLHTLTIPDTLQDSLMARLDRLVSAKGIAQLAAVIGRQFSYTLLQAASQLDEATLQHELSRLVDVELVSQRGVPPQATYVFKHALIQEAAYQSLLRSTRQQYHQQIAQVLAAQFPDLAETQPEVVARHCTAAGQDEAALRYWQQAGQRALQGSAHAEAIAHLRQGLAVLTTLPETPARLHQELDLQVALGPALLATQGNAAPDVERAYARARELCAQCGDTPQLFPVLRGLMQYYQTRGQLQTTSQLGEQLLRLAQAQPDPAPLLLAHYQLGQVVFYRGELAAAHTHHMQALALYDAQAHRALAMRYGVDLGAASHSFLARALWYLGFPAQALQRNQAACTLAEEVAHPYSLAQVLVHATTVHQYRREVLAVHAQAAAARTLATEQGFAQWVAWATVLHGWALAMQGQSEAGLAEMRQGLAADLATGSTMWQPYGLGLLAEAYGAGGHPDAGLHALAEARAVLDSTEVRYYAAELSRLKGALLQQQAVPDAVQAEACFQHALDVARQQQAKSFELRAATSLARLWQQQGKRAEAYDLLAPLYGCFTEGFDTADVQEARALLDELEG